MKSSKFFTHIGHSNVSGFLPPLDVILTAETPDVSYAEYASVGRAVIVVVVAVVVVEREWGAGDEMPLREVVETELTLAVKLRALTVEEVRLCWTGW